MAIYRGAGGAGDATGDSASEALLVRELAAEVQADANAAEAAKVAALAAQAAAETAETNAETAETNAKTAETNAETAASSASSSASTATTQAGIATTQATNASNSATAAATSASSAASSATNSANSATAAATSATNANNSANAASTSATAAAGSATSATNSATAAATSASTATTQATNAANSATAAATSATNAASSATSASGSASTATTQAGIATTKASEASTSATNAASSATAANTSATNAATSATNASNSASAASTSATNAANSASAASTSATNAANSATAAASSATSAAQSAADAITTLSTSLLKANNLSDLTNTTTARTNLGLGSIATQNSNSVSVTGGSINGTTIGASTASSGVFTSLSDSGNLTFTGTGNRITGDFSNATVANQVIWQTSTTNGNTTFQAMPNGTGVQSNVLLRNSSDLTNNAFANVRINATELGILSSATGTGTFLPLTMYTGGSERLRIDTSGSVGIGTTNTTAALTLAAASTSVFHAINTSTGGAGIVGYTDATPTAADERLGFYLFGSRGGVNGSYNSVGIQGFASQAWTIGSAQGSYLTFNTTPNNSASRIEAMRITDAGNVGIGLIPTASLGALQIQATATSGVGLLVVGETNNERIQIRASQSVGGTAVYSAFASRGNQASPSATLSGDVLGYYQLGGYDGTAWQRSAWITGVAAENYSSTNRGSHMVFSTTPTASTTIAERMRITSGGDVGIGTSSPANKFEVFGDGQRNVARANTTAGEAQVEAQVSNYFSTPTYTGTALSQLGSTATGTTCGVSNANLGRLRFQNCNSALIDTNGGAPIVFATTATERMRLDATGNLVIGSTSAQGKLHVNAATSQASIIVFTGNAAGVYPSDSFGGSIGYNFSNGKGEVDFWNNWTGAPSDGGGFAFRKRTGTSSQSTLMMLDSSGSMLVGCTSLGAWSTRITLSTNSGTTKWSVGPTAVPQDFIISATGSSGVYLAGTSATSWTAISDERHKDIIQNIENGLDKVCSLRAVIGTYKQDETNTRKPFLFAQDVLKVLPEAVDTRNQDKFGLSYTDVIPLLVSAIKELKAEVDSLKAQINQ
jgi:hypothetical protein